MTKTFEYFITNRKGTLNIAEQSFSGEVISNKTLSSCAFSKLLFSNCTFNKIDFAGSTFVNCDFNKCTFNESVLRRVEFASCSFQNCKIMDSNLDEVDVNETSFISCQFKTISLVAGYFIDCIIMECDFEEIKSYHLCALIVNSKVSKFTRSLNLEGDFNFNELLKFLESFPRAL